MKKLIIALSGLLFVPFFASASIDTNLYYGLRNNPEVMELQEFLIYKGYSLPSATGNFLPLTLKAVKKYQADNGISTTGYVGTLTRASINKELESMLAESNEEAINDPVVSPVIPTIPTFTVPTIPTYQTPTYTPPPSYGSPVVQEPTPQVITKRNMDYKKIEYAIGQNIVSIKAVDRDDLGIPNKNFIVYEYGVYANGNPNIPPMSQALNFISGENGEFVYNIEVGNGVKYLRVIYNDVNSDEIWIKL